jgi:hypothetical protein
MGSSIEALVQLRASAWPLTWLNFQPALRRYAAVVTDLRYAQARRIAM